MNISSFVREYVSKYPDKTSSDLADLILKENPDLPVTRRELVKNYIFKAFRFFEKKAQMQKEAKQRAEKIQDVEVNLEDETKWKVVEGVYHWGTQRGKIMLSVDFIDKLFYEFSEKGLNLTQTEIINKHNLKVWEWNSIKNTLQLYKKSNIFSPHTVDITPPEQLGEMIAEKINKMLSNVGLQVEKIYDKELNRAYKKAISTNEEWELKKKIFLTELADIVPQLTVELQPGLKVSKDTKGCISLFISDVHFGAESRSKDLAPYSPQITEEIFEKIAKEVNELEAKEVHIFFVGDNIESATGLNHLDSWKGLAKGYYGSQLIIKAYQVYVKFISSINNVKRIYAVPGNHDRMTERKEVDGQGFLAEILFEMIKLAFQNKLEVVYNEKIISQEVGGLNVLMSHGHLKLTDAGPADLILKYGKAGMFNLLASGHWHNRSIKKDTRTYRHIVCPSIFPGNDYSENLGADSIPGFIIVQSKNNKPIIIDYSL